MAKFKLWTNANMWQPIGSETSTVFDKGFTDGSPVYADVLNSVLYESTLFTQGVLKALNIDQSITYGISGTTPDNTNPNTIKDAILDGIVNVVDVELTNDNNNIREISSTKYGDRIEQCVDDGYIYLAIETFTPTAHRGEYVGRELIQGNYYMFREGPAEDTIDKFNVTPGNGNNVLTFNLGSTTKTYTINKTLKAVTADTLSTSAYQTIPGLKAEVLNARLRIINTTSLTVGLYQGSEITINPTTSGLTTGIIYAVEDGNAAGMMILKDTTHVIFFGYVYNEINASQGFNVLPISHVYNNIIPNGSIKMGGNS